MMFGKRVSQYLEFQKVSLGLLAVVGLTRLGLSLAGLPTSTVTWVSMNVVLWGATLYYVLAIGLVVPSLMLWGVASLVMLINKKVVRRPAAA
jgi:hypothetical protein